MTTWERSLEGLLAWRCGYASGLNAALQMMRDCQDPRGRIEREFESATAEARCSWAQAGRPQLKLN